MKFIRKKLGAIKQSIQENFARSTGGLLWIAGILSSIFVAGEIKSYFSPCPLILAGVIAGILVVLVNELLTWLTKKIFRGQRRHAIYWFVAWFCMLYSFMLASQANHIITNIVASIIAMSVVDLFSRSIWVLLKNKKYSILSISTFVVSTTAMAAFLVMLCIDGFDSDYAKEYQTMAENYGQNIEMVGDEFGTTIATGTYEVVSQTYGIKKDEDIKTDTVDLTPYTERGFLTGTVMKQYFGYELSEVPVRGKIWYPKELTNCPVLFLVHGNHSYTTKSYLGYEYLGTYLASNGYVVVSIDENSCNDLTDENDARAVLFLENMKSILQCNRDGNSSLYKKINEEKIVIAGHSRGGETVSLAYLFNQYDQYPENGSIKFDYHFSIQGILTIAPTVDQYEPADHQVALSDVNYLVLQGADDYDVTSAMGEKQYNNITYSGNGTYIKSMLYIAGANHGQFNHLWGRYDLYGILNRYLNVKNLMSQTEQQTILKIFAKVFMDVVGNDDTTYEDLLTNYERYTDYLPDTIYQQIYQKSDFTVLSNFEEDSNLQTASRNQATISTEHMKTWTEERRILGSGGAGENYVLHLEWKNTDEAMLRYDFNAYDLEGKALTFDIADGREDCCKDGIDGEVVFRDENGKEAVTQISDNTIVYPTLPVQLRKLDCLFGDYEFKHQMQTVTISMSNLQKKQGTFDESKITQIEIHFNKNKNGNVQIDNVGFEKEE